MIMDEKKSIKIILLPLVANDHLSWTLNAYKLHQDLKD